METTRSLVATRTLVDTSISVTDLSIKIHKATLCLSCVFCLKACLHMSSFSLRSIRKSLNWSAQALKQSPDNSFATVIKAARMLELNRGKDVKVIGTLHVLVCLSIVHCYCSVCLISVLSMFEFTLLVYSDAPHPQGRVS